MSCRKMKTLVKEWTVRRPPQLSMTVNVQNVGLEAMISMKCPYCTRSTTIQNTTTKYYGTNYAGEKQNNQNCSWYATNVKLVLGTLAVGMGPSDIPTLFTFLGLLKLQSFCKTQFQRIEGLVGKYMR